jgi:hypothetical protein
MDIDKITYDEFKELVKTDFDQFHSEIFCELSTKYSHLIRRDHILSLLYSGQCIMPVIFLIISESIGVRLGMIGIISISLYLLHSRLALIKLYNVCWYQEATSIANNRLYDISASILTRDAVNTIMINTNILHNYHTTRSRN